MTALKDSEYYAYTVGTEVRLISFVGAQPVGKIAARYTSDQHNHPAPPHKRYVIACGSGPKLCIADVSEKEMERIPHFEDFSGG